LASPDDATRNRPAEPFMSLSISVVIPAYKSAPWIEETIRSVLRQTYPLENVELIVVDDASPDDTVAVVRKLLEASTLKSQLIVREKNAGAPANRNAGWRAAKGDWIQFLDHDDALMPHKLQLQADCATQAPEDVGLIYSSWKSLELIDGTWQPSGPVNAPFVDDDTVPQILIDPTFGYVGPALMRKSALLAVNGFEEVPNLGEDTNLMLRLAMAGWKFRAAHSQGHAFLYRQTPGSLWKSYAKNLGALWNLLLTFRSGEQFLRGQQPGRELREDIRRALAAQYGRRARFFVEPEPEKFRIIQSWLDNLGYPVPPDLGKGMTLASKVLGYGNALRLRAKFVSLREQRRD
jgi:glycosyltransferase involved in cell wall biosynthesis